ncbi:MAG: restriction endonuclease subunit S [Cytophagales bacterium CG12_big_fil_rev_8_21_14_0_65_40_12]|nr:MAG: restriction endonuclease subunit S [Cytophagales bacterium CG12_big_fil_rev_8_21_14_0_65_40_12]
MKGAIMSTFNKAFKGELVAQDANDVPAEVLSERVKKSRRDETMLEKKSKAKLKTPKG